MNGWDICWIDDTWMYDDVKDVYMATMFVAGLGTTADSRGNTVVCSPSCLMAAPLRSLLDNK